MMQEVSGQTVSGYKFDDVTIDLTDFRVQKNGAAQRITPKAFEVLVYLIENQGRVVEKQELFSRIWKDSFVTDNALTRVVKEIRQVIGDQASAPLFIETVPKRGYRFIAEVETIQTSKGKPGARGGEFQNDSQTSAKSGSPDSEKSFEHPAVKTNRFKLWFIVAAVLLSGVVLLAVWLFNQKQTATVPVIARTSQITSWSGLDNYPAISPDGNSIAYSSNHSDESSFEIYVKPLATGAREIQVTSDGAQNFHPAWSPDGQQIAFYSRKRGGIWIVPATGGSARQLTDFGAHPAWSPDGKTIAFQSGVLTDLGANSRTIPPSVLWLVPAAGGEAKQLTRTGNPAGGHGLPAFSPNGKKIAFTVEDVASFGFWTIEMETGNLRQIVQNASDPKFAPDGKSIYYSMPNGIWKADISSTTGEVLGEPAQIIVSGAMPIRHLSLSADGKRLAYTMFRSDSNIWSVPLEPKTGNSKGDAAPLFENTSIRNSVPSFSPDGRRIAFVSSIPGTRGILFLMDSDGKNQTQTSFVTIFPSWFPDNVRIGSLYRPGESLVFSSFDPSTGKQTDLLELNDGEYARLSPDGKEIAYNSKKSGTINIWMASLENGAQKQLTFDNELMGFPAWSPDGKLIALQVKRGDNTHIALIPREGGTVEQLTSEQGQSWVYSFSPDGDKIAFAGQRDYIWNVYWISRSTKQQKRLTNNTKLNSFVRYPAWSPQGDKIVFEYAETRGNIWLTEFK